MKRKIIHFPTLSDLDKPELFVSISDNVLDDDDYPIVKLSLKGGYVVKAELVKPGIYSFSDGPSIGWNSAMILEWLDYDPTGYHPEIYHNLLERFTK